MKWLWIVPLILLGLLLLILIVPAKARVIYDGTVRVRAGMGPIWITILPRKPKKPKKKAKPKREKPAKQTKAKKEPSKTETKGKTKDPNADKPSEKTADKGQKPKLSVERIKQYLQLGVFALGRLRKMITVRRFVLHVTIAHPDAAQAAMRYGSAAAVTSTILPMLKKALRIKKHDIAIDVDFSGEGKIFLDITASTVLLGVLLGAWRVFRAYRTIDAESKQSNQTGKVAPS